MTQSDERRTAPSAARPKEASKTPPEPPAPGPENPNGHASADDATLVRAIAAGDQAALADLYDRYAALLLALCERVLGRRSEAEDLVHDLFIEVWQQARTYDPARGAVRSWLVLRARSRSLDRLRSAAWRRLVFAEPPADSAVLISPEPASGLTERVPADAVQRELADLPGGERAVLELVYFNGLTLAEVAERLLIPLGTVKSRLSRALERLRRALDTPENRGES